MKVQRPRESKERYRVLIEQQQLLSPTGLFGTEELLAKDPSPGQTQNGNGNNDDAPLR